MLFGWVLIGAISIGVFVWLLINLAPAARHTLRHRVDAPAEGETPIDDASLPPAAIISPGRNEATWLPSTLPRLCQQDYPNLKIVFIDDNSDDDSSAITADVHANHDNLLVVHNTHEPPAGWVGKCWAIQQGYNALCNWECGRDEQPVKTRVMWPRDATLRSSHAEWVCFTDADIEWEPQLLRAAMQHALEHDADMVALFPGLEFGSAVEAVVQQTMVLALGLFFPFDKAMDPDYPDTLTGGAFMLVRRSLYDSFGGHEAVKSFVIEDINLGRTVKKHRGKIRIAIADNLLRCRMYEGWADMWEGLTKNAYAGIDYKLHIGLAAVVGVVVANVLSPIYLVISIAWLAMDIASEMAWLAVALSMLLVLLQARPMNDIRRMLRLPWPFAFAVSPGSFLYLLITVASMWQYYRKGNVWKGRSYNRDALADKNEN